jgi:hypothetical protein
MMVDGNTLQQLKDELEAVTKQVRSLQKTVSDLTVKTQFLEDIDPDELKATIAHIKNSKNSQP